MTPFESFFAGDFRKMLANARSAQSPFTNGGSIADASWDRRAAFLLWEALERIDQLEDRDVGDPW